MTSLATCIRKAGKALSREDADAIREIRTDMVGDNPGLAAVNEYLQVMNEDLAALMAEIEAHGGRPGKLAAFSPRLMMEDIELIPDDVLEAMDPSYPGVQRRFAEYVTSRDWADIVDEYRALDGMEGPENTENGRINSVDSWRELSEDYRNNRSVSAAVHEVGSALSKKFYYEFLAEPPAGGAGSEYILFTSGGTGVAKTSGLGLSEYAEGAAMVFDGNLAKGPSAEKKIDAALASGRLVVVNHTIREPIEALRNGAVTRAMRQERENGTGRPVPLSGHVGTNLGASNTIRYLNSSYRDDSRMRYEYSDNTNGKGNIVPTTIDSVLNFDYNEKLQEAKAALKDIYENGHPQTNGYPLSTKLYHAFLEEPVPEGAGRFHANFEGYVEADRGATEGVPREGGRGAPRTYSRGEPEGDGALPQQVGVQQAQLQLALAPAIRALVGVAEVNIVQSTAELPVEAAPSDVEGMWQSPDGRQVWLVADNLPTAERAKKVFAHEAFGHMAMERMPEFDEILISVRNLLAMNNRTVLDVAEKVARTQGNLDETTQAKEILAVMVEDGVENTVVGRAVAAIRQALRRMGLLDGVNYSESEIKALLVRAARDITGEAAAKQAALAGMPVEQQVLEDPTSVAEAVNLALREVYANQTMLDHTGRLTQEAVGATPERAAEINAALYQSRLAPTVGPDHMDPDALYARAYHGTAALPFQRFDINFVGSGDGNAAYGWGLYFSAKKAVAEWYRGSQVGSAAGGNVIEAEVPDFDEVLDFDLTLNHHAPAVRDAIRAEFPELWEEQYVDYLNGDPVSQKDVQALIDIGEDYEALGYRKGVPASTMKGKEFYNWVGHMIQNENRKPEFMKEPAVVAALKKVMGGFVSVSTGQASKDEIASKFLRDVAGLPGHSFIGHMSDERNYVIYDDSRIDITRINETEASALFSRTPEFKAWFKDSKVVDDAGQPQMVFHGTQVTEPFTEFAPDPTKSWGGWNSFGTWFSSEPEHAGVYSAMPDEGQYGQVFPTYLSMQDPWQPETWEQLATWMQGVLEKAGTDQISNDAGPILKAELQQLGYDGVILRNFDGDSKGGLPVQDVFVPIESTQIKSAYGNRGTYDANDPNILFSRALPSYAEHRAMQDLMRLRDATKRITPDPAQAAGAELRLQGDQGPGWWWKVASEAGTRAFAQPKDSWEERYYSEMGRQASQLARGPKVAPMEQQEQMDMLFSRTAQSETPDNLAQPSKPFLVYRFGKGSDSLQNRNAGNAASVARRLAVFDDYESPQSGNADADTVSVYQVVADQFTDYTRMNRGRADEETGPGVGRYTPGPSKTNAKYQEISYSFGKDGYAAEKVGQMSLAELYDSLQREFGYSNFDMSGSAIGAEALERQTPEAMFSRYVHPDTSIEDLRGKVLSPAAEDITTKDRVRGVVERIKGIEWLGIKQGIIDSSAAVESLEKGLFGGLLDASASAYKAILSTRNLGSVMAAVMHRGIPIYQNGVFTARTGRKGMIEIFQPITHHAEGNLLPLWELYAAATRANRLIKEKNRDGTLKEKMFTQDEIDKALTLETQFPEFKTAFLEWQKFNSQLLDLAIKNGVINGDEAKVWRQNDYVPFYRAMEDVEYQGGQGPQVSGRGGVANVRSGIKRLTGSEKPIGNVFENMVMNTSYLMDAIYRNTAMQRVAAMADGIAMQKIPMAFEAIKFKDSDLARALMKAGLIVGTGATETDMFNDGIRQIKAMTAEQKEHWSTLFRRVAPRGDNIVSVLLDGKPVYYEVTDPLLMRSIAAMGAQSWGGVMNVFRLAKRTLTKAVTIDPAFMMANFIRDSLSTAVVTKGNGVKQITGAIKGLRQAWAEDEDMLAMMMAGAGGGGFYDHNPADVRKMLAKKMPGGDVSAFMNSVLTPRGMWRFWQKIGNASEQANRIAIYKRTIAEGGTAAEAAYQARDVLNFTMAGDYQAMRAIVQTVPFLNARIQGLYRLYRGGRENPAGFAMKGSVIMAATLALLLKNQDDDRYRGLPEWDKDTYWHFFIGDEHFRLPKPFEVGAIFATVPERMFMLARGDDDFGVTMERATRMMADTFAFNPIPQAIKPIWEQYSNRNMFTGNPIVGFALEGLEPEAQYDPWTSETMREMSKVLPGWGGSPKRLEAFIRGYFGAIGMYAMGASDSVTRRAFGHPDRPTKAIQDYPVLTRFWRNPEPRTSKYANQMYDMLNEADSLYKTMNAYRKQHRIEEAQELLEGNKSKLQVRAYLHDIATDVRKVNHKVKAIQYSDMDPDRKKTEIDRLNRIKLKLVAKSARFSDIF